MNETEFTLIADRTLQAIAQAFDRLDADCDSSFKGDGVLEVEFENGKIIINRHAAAQEIWVAARAGGYHFRLDDSRWVGTRDGRELFAVLAALASGHTGRAVTLEPPPGPAGDAGAAS